MYSRYHVDITTSCLGSKFSQPALEQIVAANLAQDALPNILGARPELHFDDDLVAESLAYIDSEHRVIARLARGGDVAAQWAAFGRLLHTAQDFYAHSNYVDLWLATHGGLIGSEPSQIDGLESTIMDHPGLRTGHFVVWRDLIYYVPLLRQLARHFWVPAGSHEAMHLDGPQRGPRFYYALEAAKQRTCHEYDRALASILAAGGPEARDRFHGGADTWDEPSTLADSASLPGRDGLS